MKKYFRALTIAGSDSGGGAGIQADLKTFSALGCYGMSVITALTAQNTVGVQGIFDISPEFIKLQMQSVISDLGVDAVKIGMLHSSEIIRVVSESLGEFQIQNVILDPVMVAKGGQSLLKEEAIQALQGTLLPKCQILTPNLPEAEKLLGRAIEEPSAMEKAARDLLDFGPQCVIVKGGHLHGPESADCVVLKQEGGLEMRWLKAPRVLTRNTHGTGCTFSSAIASGRAKGQPIMQSIIEAKDYLTRALIAGAQYQLGKGHGPVQHFP